MMRPAVQLFLGARLLQCAALGAATIEVTTNADMLGDEGLCSLREAVIAANTDSPSGSAAGECAAGSGADVISLTVDGPFLLTRAGTLEDAALTGDLDLLGDVEIRGTSPEVHVVSGQLLDRVFHVPSARIVSLQSITIAGGSPSIFEKGGGIWKRGEMTLTDCVVRDNLATNDAGGIYSREGSLTLDRTTLRNNHADRDGGGIYAEIDGPVTVIDSIIDANRADGEGGGIVSWDELSVVGSIISGNVAGNSGGGLLNVDPATIIGSTFLMNRADLGGAIHSRDLLTVRNSTFLANTAHSEGSGLHNFFRPATLSHVTFGGGATESSVISNRFGPLTLVNTVIVGWCERDLPVSNGGNIESPGDTCSLTEPSDQTGVSKGKLNLLPLAENGGPTPTQLPGVGSFTTEAGVLGGCLLDDQRGSSRPADYDGVGGPQCDVGAVELQACPDPILLNLEHDMLAGSVDLAACERIILGPDLEVASGADVEMLAGDAVVLKDGASVAASATLKILVDWPFWEEFP